MPDGYAESSMKLTEERDTLPLQWQQGEQRFLAPETTCRNTPLASLQPMTIRCQAVSQEADVLWGRSLPPLLRTAPGSG